MKTCFRCHNAQPIDCFYPHPRMRDGHLNKCKSCTKADAAETYRQKVASPDGLEAERRRGRDKYSRLYSVGPNWKSPEADPVTKRRAQIALGNAVRGGHVTKPDLCSACGSAGRIHGHHPNYYEPLSVEWLCPPCHRVRHATHPERIHRSA